MLVVEDERDVARLLTFNLCQAGFDADSAATAADALLMSGRQPPTVVVLDVNLPDLSGIEVCRRLRADPALGDVGILMLTAMGDDEHRIAGLEAGADDYVVKPFNVQEIVLRVRALIRRIGERRQARDSKPGRVLECGNLSVDPDTHEVLADGQQVELRPLELKLLLTMLAEPGRVFTREELLRRVWDITTQGNPRTVDVHIRRLRKNLGPAAGVVATVPGFGYRVIDA